MFVHIIYNLLIIFFQIESFFLKRSCNQVKFLPSFSFNMNFLYFFQRIKLVIFVDLIKRLYNFLFQFFAIFQITILLYTIIFSKILQIFFINLHYSNQYTFKRVTIHINFINKMMCIFVSIF